MAAGWVTLISNPFGISLNCWDMTPPLPKLIKFLFPHLELSRGEICVANFIPPANGARLGKYSVGLVASVDATAQS